VGRGARLLLGGKVAALEPPVDRVALVQDLGTPGRLVEELVRGLEEAGLRVSRRVLPGGEMGKRLEFLLDLWRWMLDEELTRSSIVVAVGGGAVTDTAGFAAATYMRGVRWVTVPTTLLGMADAGVGGKTAVNLAGKNMVGAFHQPRLVVADTEFAETLTEIDYRSGLAEIAKHGLIAGGSFYRWLLGSAESLLSRSQEALEKAVAESIDVKMEIVARDPREEKGIRAILNLGHTYGHALEKASGYMIPHGHAVAAGLAVEAAAAAKTLGLPEARVEEIRSLLARLGLPDRPPRSPSCEEAVKHVRLDKKRRGGRLLLPLLEDVGRPRLVELPLEEARRLLLDACRELAP